jgi:ribosomal protein S18 acetylase RimI-like enzyme
MRRDTVRRSGSSGSSIFSIRLATESDIASLCSFDHVAQHDSQRKDFIRHSVDTGTCFVSVTAEQIVGYGVLVYSFYGNGFISMLMVHPDYRRRGVGAGLMRYFESICQTTKLFTSTNLSNSPMQALLTKLGYRLSGVIHNLDDGDPELVYFKLVGRVGT